MGVTPGFAGWRRNASIRKETERTGGHVTTTFDTIIIGGGAAGCVLANRLSARSTVASC